MWGENWGEMIWGSANSASAVQVPLGPWALILLGFMLGLCAVYANRNRKTRLLPFAIVLAVPVVSAIAATLPHTFANGTTANADQVNANFDELLTNLNALEQRVALLESALTVSDNGFVTLEGLNVTIKASTTLDLSSSVVTSIKGSTLILNNGALPNARVNDPVQVTCIAPALGAAFVCNGFISPSGNPTTLN